MASELIEALNMIEREKDISREEIISAIEGALVTAYKNQYNKRKDSLLAAENVFAIVDEESGEFFVYAEKEVVDEVENGMAEISLEDARMIYPDCEVGETVRLAAESAEFSRIATQNAKNVLLQSLRESEKDNIFEEYKSREFTVTSGIVSRFTDKGVIVNLGRADGILNLNEQVRGEKFKINDRIKVYVLEVRKTKKNLRILVSRTHPELVRSLFESEVAEVKDGTVEIKSIAREAGSRTKMAVISNDPDVDPIGACVGLNGMRVNNVVSELRGEKIDIINWSENSAELIENSLSPAKVISVITDDEEKTATVIVPDFQLSLAIGKEGQNARLAARLTGFKIDILNETQAADLLNEIYAGYEGGKAPEGNAPDEDAEGNLSAEDEETETSHELDAADVTEAEEAETEIEESGENSETVESEEKENAEAETAGSEGAAIPDEEENGKAEAATEEDEESAAAGGEENGEKGGE